MTDTSVSDYSNSTPSAEPPPMPEAGLADDGTFTGDQRGLERAAATSVLFESRKSRRAIRLQFYRIASFLIFTPGYRCSPIPTMPPIRTS
jgi:hypothetical protein